MKWPSFRLQGSGSGSSGEASTSTITVCWNSDGIEYRFEPLHEGRLSQAVTFGASTELVMLLGQLEEEGFARNEPACVKLSWPDFYRLLASPEHGSSVAFLRLPRLEAWRPILSSKETLIDQDFSVSIAGWIDPSGQRPRGNVSIDGAVIKSGSREALLPENTWRVVEAVAKFWSRPLSERVPDSNRLAWSAIRSYAMSADADLTDLLRKTVVLSPERLRIGMRKGGIDGANMVEVQPQFDGAPERWLEIFDRLNDVPQRYDIPDGNGIVHVMLSPEVRTVLREIRKMPGRRIAGDRAEAFLRNPFATLGPDASTVIDPVQFESAREEAGISFASFTARVMRDKKGFPYDCSLLITEVVQGEVISEELRFEGVKDLEKFLGKIDARKSSGAQCCHWAGFDLEILGDTPGQLNLLRAALRDMTAPSGVAATDIFDLSKYSERVEGFGVEKPYYSPFISRKTDEDGWFPENVDFGICYTPEGGGETVAIVLNDDTIEAFRDALNKAEAENQDSFYFSGCPKPIPVDWANETLNTLNETRNAISKGQFDPKSSGPKVAAAERKGLVVKPNVDTLDYEERRGSLAPTGAPPRLPASLLPKIALKEHQLTGVAWLQHLWGLSPVACRGALLADDMGLGKTVQLLTFIAAAIEEKPSIDPFLVVAPVSLLENWIEEIAKFFTPGAMRVLTLYGPSLAEKRVPKQALDDALVQGGATRLLMPGWLGEAKVVLTTYETLRDLEFSLAAQHWSVMICDEAQKIKNPNALVTRAAKKQNATFKIACTGTPVENTLTDIWCLYDFVQPGLLGALKDFGNLYRRPIEAESELDKARLVELRALIEPQMLRRTKAEVAKDLPKKIEVAACRMLPLSDRQRVLYADAAAAFRKRDIGSSATGLQTPLGLLQYLRRLCSDPRPPGHISTDSESILEIERRSPKMAWLLRQLRDIEVKGEKVIVFCEFRDLQRTLQRAICDRFGNMPDVINGDTSTNSASDNNRQRRIRKFQEKPGFGVIILSPLAVGFGVNIQAANHVIHFTRTWNPAKEDQATDRAYRIGQTKDVYVYYPVIVAHDFLTFDAKLDKLLSTKRSLSYDVLNGAGDVNPADFGDLQAPDGGNAFGNEFISVHDIGSLNSDAFEAFCALLWSKQGYTKTFKTGRVGDGGVDVLAIRGSEGVAIQCKSSGIEGRKHGWEAVKDVSAGLPAYAKRYSSVKFTTVAVTNQLFNDTARQQAQVLNVELIDGNDLARMMEKYPMKEWELQQFLLSGWAAQ